MLHVTTGYFQLANINGYGNTVNARISAQLQISAHFKLALLLRLKIYNKRPPSNKRPPPSLEKKLVSELGTIYETYAVHMVLLKKCDIVK